MLSIKSDQEKSVSSQRLIILLAMLISATQLSLSSDVAASSMNLPPVVVVRRIRFTFSFNLCPMENKVHDIIIVRSAYNFYNSLISFGIAYFDDCLLLGDIPSELPLVAGGGVSVSGRGSVSPSLSRASTLRPLNGIVPSGLDICCIQVMRCM